MKNKLLFILVTILWLMTVIITKSFGASLDPASLIKAALNVFDAIVSVAWGFYLSNVLTANKRAIEEVTNSFDHMLHQFKNRIEDLASSLMTMAATKDLDPEFIRGSEYIMGYLSQTMRNSMESDARLIKRLGGNDIEFIKCRENEFNEIYTQATLTLSGISADNRVYVQKILSSLDPNASHLELENTSTEDKFRTKSLAALL
jgi:hypothetical protein